MYIDRRGDLFFRALKQKETWDVITCRNVGRCAGKSASTCSIRNCTGIFDRHSCYSHGLYLAKRVALGKGTVRLIQGVLLCMMLQNH